MGSHKDISALRREVDPQLHLLRAGERGSAPLLMLIALILSFALFYTMVVITDEGQGNGGVSRTLSDVSRVTQFPATVRIGVNKMINGGMTPDKLDFTADGVSQEPGSGVFVTGEGGIILQSPPPGTGTQWVFTAENSLPAIGKGGKADIVAVLPGLSPELCAAINSNLRGQNFIPPLTTRIKHEKNYDGSGFPESPNQPGNARGDLNGERFMCVSQDPAEGDEREFIYYYAVFEN